MGLGPVLLIGSGETSASSGQAFEALAKRLPHPLHVAVLETPAGFELNSAQVAGRARLYLQQRLQNDGARVSQVAARRQGTPFSPNEASLVEDLLDQDLIFMGPGSPTYAVRQLRDSLAWAFVLARHRLGAGLAFASAAVLAVSHLTLPVYEIYKVGQDLHWVEGLDLFGAFGLDLVFIPHWNNRDGGEELDTRFCFMGAERFGPLCALLPESQIVLGLDEHTSLMIDIQRGECRVYGRDAVHVLRDGKEQVFGSGQVFDLQLLGRRLGVDGFPAQVTDEIWRAAQERAARALSEPEIPQAVFDLTEEREAARQACDWARADDLRRQVLQLGWKIQDTPNGVKILPI